MRKLIFLSLAILPVFGGQSIQLGSATAGNSSIPAQTPGNPWRVEFSVHNWSTSFSGIQENTEAAAVGLNIQWQNLGAGDIRLQMYSTSAVGATQVCQIEGLGSGGPNGGGSIYTNLFLTVRFQEDPIGLMDYCQGWDALGNLVWSQAYTFTSNTGSNSNGAVVGGLGPGDNLSTAYFRIYTTIVSSNATPPTTAQDLTGCLWSLRFDGGNNTGNLNDNCTAGPYSATMSSGFPTYIATPFQGLMSGRLFSRPVVPSPLSGDPQLWITTTGANAGCTWDASNSNTSAAPYLDASEVYSQQDSSPTPSSYAWSFTAGPNTPTITSPTSATSSVTGAVSSVGSTAYIAQLVVEDAAMNTATLTLAIGAVNMNANGVVQTGSSDVDLLFGPMIAFCQNPWGYQDYWALHASTLRLTDYTTQASPNNVPIPWITGASNKPQWEYLGSGTISFYFNCIGGIFFCNSSVYSGTISGASVTTGASSFTVSTITGLDLSSFPTHVVLYDGSDYAEVRISSNSGTTLNVAYDGWGNETGGYGALTHTFATGTLVLQSKVVGTGTHFETDTSAPVCPLGVGPPGPSLYSAGTVALTAGSAAMTGTGTVWTSSMVGDFVVVSAMESVVAFNFIAQISAWNSATSITLNRVFPSTATTASGLAYNVMLAQRTLVPRYPHAIDPSGPGELTWGTSDCESDTALYLNPFGAYNTYGLAHDIPALNGIGLDGILVNSSSCTGCGVYGITDSSSWVNSGSAGGISFYGESVAHRSLGLRSGLKDQITAANYIADWWIKSPYANADGSGTPRLFLGGEGIGTFMHAVVDNVPSLWPDLRGYAYMGVQMINGFTANGCNSYDDTRDSGYAFAWLILASIYDPDTSSTAAPGGIPWRTYWQSKLSAMQAIDTTCESQVSTGNAPHSWANGFLFNNNIYPQITVTNGSAAAVGIGIPSTLCEGTASGTATVTNGSNILTVVTGTVPTATTDPNFSLFLTGTMGGGATVFVNNLDYIGPSGSAVTLGGNWLGDSGTITWMSELAQGLPSSNAPAMMTIAGTNNDLTDLQKNWACIWNSSTSITLNRPWDGSSGGYYPVNAAGYGIGLVGFGQQPFMLGIKTYGMYLLAMQMLPALASYKAPYTSFSSDAASWVWNVGMDQQLLTTNYGRIFQEVEPTNTVPNGTNLYWRAPAATYGGNLNGLSPAREQNAETAAAHAIYYGNNPTNGNLLLGDKFYGAVWGYCPWTKPGFYCDQWSTAGNPNASNLLDGYIHAGKWTGFFTGIGMTHRWPAVRLKSLTLTPSTNTTAFSPQ